MTRRAWSVAIFARHRGRVLLIHHRRLGVWLPPGGEVEANELPLEAARRELAEETGLVGRFPSLGAPLAVQGTPPGLIGYEEHHAGSKGLHLNFAFVADVDTDAVIPNSEISSFRWVTSAEGLDAPANVGELLALALAAPSAEDVPGTRFAPPTATVETPAAEVERLRAIGERWLTAFNARDLDALLSLYADDAIHYSPKLRARADNPEGHIHGQVQLREWWADSFARLTDLRYVPRTVVADRGAPEKSTAGLSGRVFMEYVRQLPGEPDLEVAELLEVRGGLIRQSRVFHG